MELNEAQTRLGRVRQRTTMEQIERAISFRDLQIALFDRAKANGDDPGRAAEKMLAALDTSGRMLRLKGRHYFLFLDEWGPEPNCDEEWLAVMDAALNDATLRMSH